MRIVPESGTSYFVQSCCILSDVYQQAIQRGNNRLGREPGWTRPAAAATSTTPVRAETTDGSTQDGFAVTIEYRLRRNHIAFPEPM